MPVVVKQETSPYEEFVFEQLAASPEQRTEDIDCRLLSSAELILHNVAQLRFVHVSLERPEHADQLVSVISGLRKGQGRPAHRDGMLVFPNILDEGIDPELANRYLDKIEEVEDDNDPAYNAKDYLYLINSVSISRHAMVEAIGPKSGSASEGLIETLADSAGQTDKPMIVVLSEEPMSQVTQEEYVFGAPENLNNQANMEIVVSRFGIVTSFSRYPRIDTEEL